MPTIRHKLLPVLLTLCLGSLPGVYAADRADPAAAGSAGLAPVATAAAYREGISLDEAVARAERQYNARVVRTEVQDEDGRTVYVLKLLTDSGRVITVRIDAATGRSR